MRLTRPKSFARDAVLNRTRRVLALKRRDQAKAKGGEG